VGVVQQPVHGRGGQRLGHELVEAGGVEIGADRHAAAFVGGVDQPVQALGGVGTDRAARRRATTRSFADSYRRWRPMVERSIAWLVADGCRRVPYHGIQRNHTWLSVRVAALNLRRLLILGLTRRDEAWVLA
jgi:hypothetical protein